MGAQNRPNKIPYTDPETGEEMFLDPVEWMLRTGVTRPGHDCSRERMPYLGRWYLRGELAEEEHF